MEFRRLSRVKNCRGNFRDALRPIKRFNKYDSSNHFARGLSMEPRSEKARPRAAARPRRRGKAPRGKRERGKLFVGIAARRLPRGQRGLGRKHGAGKAPVKEPNATTSSMPFNWISTHRFDLFAFASKLVFYSLFPTSFQ